jgi:Ribbon-helix-helix protein, copG family
MTGYSTEDRYKVQIWMPSDLAKASMRRANDSGISLSELIRRLLTEYLEH